MLGLYGYSHAIQNIYAASAAMLGERQVETLADLRSFYLDALSRLAPTLPINRSQNKFIEEAVKEEQLRAFFKASVLDDLRQDEVIGDAYAPRVKHAKITRALGALEKLSNRNIEFARVFDVMVHSVFVRSARTLGKKHPRAGTTSLAPGVIWLAVHESESTEDLMEIFVHELTHLLLFTDELVNKQFHYARIKKKETYSRSAILGGVRPLDKVIHSMVVGTEIIMARETFLSRADHGTGAHPASEVIAAGVCSAHRGLLDLPSTANILTAHTRQIIERCVTRCRPLDANATAAL